jgi:hypothetical protein
MQQAAYAALRHVYRPSLVAILHDISKQLVLAQSQTAVFG